MKIYLETMGCQMNQLDSELVIGALLAAGHEIVDDARSAEVALYNTCSVRGHAEQKVLSRLGSDGQRKAAGVKLIVGVLGCMAQRMGGKLAQEYPAVDLICGPGQLYRINDMIAEAATGKTVVALDPSRKELANKISGGDGGGQVAGDWLSEMDRMDQSRDTAAAGATAQAYVRVMRGCDKFCTYCIVPYVRGGESCRAPESIIREVTRLVDSGRTEITLLGQTVNSYKWPGGGSGKAVRFSNLLAKASAVPGLRRLRFVTSHPIDFGDDILAAMRDLPNICRYVHIPAQSGSDAVLARMNRKYTRAQYDELVDRARAIVPEVVLAGDFIVGFPGETEEDHRASGELIRRSGYKNSFIFKYSPRPGTVAAKQFKDDVPAADKKRRNNELLAVQAEVSLAHNQSYIGRTVEVLAEGPSPHSARQAAKASVENIQRERARSVSECDDKKARAAGLAGDVTQLVGRTRGDHIVVFDGQKRLAGQYINVRITGATALTLFGKLTKG